jgi:16S rRNA (uracil1498-N3)-methyltransferase
MAEREAGALRRLFAPDLPDGGGELSLPADSVHHARVLRLGVGARIQLFDGRSGQADATVTSVSRDAMRCDAGPRRELPAPSPQLHLALGLPKGSKLESIVRMLTELGVSSLQLALCERSVPRPSQTESAARLARLRRIALEACAQSGQARALEVHAPAPLLDWAEAAPVHCPRLVFWERARAPLHGLKLDGQAPAVWAVVGPEGGLAESEVETLTAMGFAAIGLGPALLRVETAAPAISALLLERLGRFGG